VRELRGLRAAVVGGFVRDSLIGRVPREIDLVVEGDTAELAAALGGTLTSYEPFLAARVSRDGWSIDITQARSERYPQPGALPIVEPASLEDDLARRDFTVNAIAVTLDGGDLLAVDGALEDLAARRLRVLHDESFIDDPTRVMRLARYSRRLGFSVEPHTAALAQAARLDTLTGARIAAELRLALLEPDPLAPLADLSQKLPITADRPLVEAALALTPEDGSRELVVLAAVIREHAPSEWIGALELTAHERDIVLGARHAPEIATAIEAAESPSALRERLRHVTLEIDGHDLIAAGIAAGPELGARLERTLARKLDGQLAEGREAELASALGDSG
jgi:tRNA nucleotidyltransferase (CCA-adding enzyme)